MQRDEGLHCLESVSYYSEEENYDLVHVHLEVGHKSVACLVHFVVPASPCENNLSFIYADDGDCYMRV